MADMAKLYYFRGRGRAEQTRWMLSAAGIEFENHVLETNDDFVKLRDSGALIYNQLPLLVIDGQQLCQSQSIIRYLARRCSLYGDNNIDAVRADMTADAVNDFQSVAMMHAFCSDREVNRAQSAPKMLARWAPLFERTISSTSGWVVDSGMTYADIVLAEALTSYDFLVPGYLDSYPRLKELRQHVIALPGIAAYLDSENRFPFPDGETGDVYRAHVNAVLGR